MFTGIVTDIGEIVALTPTAQGQLHRMRIACRYDQTTIADGASIACNGVCLTVVASGVEGGKTRFHKFYFEPEFKGGNHGVEDCRQR